jgi:hypothetical protein
MPFFLCKKAAGDTTALEIISQAGKKSKRFSRFFIFLFFIFSSAFFASFLTC